MRKILLLSALLISSIMFSQSTVSDGEWGTSSTWNTNQVPADTDNVTISHSIDIDNARTCANLTIDSGARLDVDAALTATGTVTNNGDLRVRNADMTHSGTTFSNTGDSFVKVSLNKCGQFVSMQFLNVESIIDFLLVT